MDVGVRTLPRRSSSVRGDMALSPAGTGWCLKGRRRWQDRQAQGGIAEQIASLSCGRTTNRISVESGAQVVWKAVHLRPRHHITSRCRLLTFVNQVPGGPGGTEPVWESGLGVLFHLHALPWD